MGTELSHRRLRAVGRQRGGGGRARGGGPGGGDGHVGRAGRVGGRGAVPPRQVLSARGEVVRVHDVLRRARRAVRGIVASVHDGTPGNSKIIIHIKNNIIY